MISIPTDSVPLRRRDGSPRHPGFTLLELLIVIGIMGLLGTVSVSGFRGLRRGMEERATMQVVDEFVRSAYRRAVIDRVPVSVYFWNETISDETIADKLIVVGRAVAVRRAGRITAIDGNFLVDEFGDLADETYRDEEGEVDPNYDYTGDSGRYMYRVGDKTFARSVVSSSSVERPNLQDYLMSRSTLTSPKMYPIKAYGYYLKDQGNIGWKVGDPYGFEISELTLPHNFIFGSSYSTSVSSPEKEVSQVMVFAGEKTPSVTRVTVSGLKLDKSGAVSFKAIGQSEDPTKDR